MTNALNRLNARLQWKHMLLLGLALLCVVTALESVAPQVRASSQQGFYTISGTRSTTEVFTAAGTYRLHDPSGNSPNCQRCKPLEVEANVESHPEMHASDFFNRALPNTSTRIETAEWSICIVWLSPQRLVTKIVAPEPPPPQKLTLNIV